MLSSRSVNLAALCSFQNDPEEEKSAYRISKQDLGFSLAKKAGIEVINFAAFDQKTSLDLI